MTKTTLAEAVSSFGAQAKAKLDNKAISGEPEEQLRTPLERLFHDLGALHGLADGALSLVGETSLAHLQIRPDYAVTVNNLLMGFIEVKAPGKGCNPAKFASAHDKAQWAKLKSLPNLLYTDGNGFSLWRSGERAGNPVLLEGDVETSGAKLQAPGTLAALFSDFLTWNPEPPANAKRLAEVSARLCRLLRDEVVEQMAQGHQSLLHLREDWKKLLFPNASNEQFADGYAQAVTFGLLMAKAFDISLKDDLDIAASHLKKSNTLIGTALNLLTEDESSQKALSTSLGTLRRVLDAVNWHTISKDKPEAWLYFYEDFLEVYDNKLKKLTGSYYTPPEVVSAMVRLVDEALKGPLFQRSAGLAASDVTIADPAVGTGTFLLGVLQQIARNVEGMEGEGAVKSAIESAAKRLFGFELQFGPFAVAQLRLLAELRALLGVEGGEAKIPALNLFITDTLGDPYEIDRDLLLSAEPIAKSRRDANKIKRSQPITVVIGNPPYKNKADKQGGWIEVGGKAFKAPLDRWIPPKEWKISAHTHHLKNLYIFFWRWATLKVFGSGWKEATGEPETDRHGLVCYITAAGFLAGPGFQKMREDLRRDCSAIWVIDCSPEGHQPDVPTRIFQGVQQPICIVIAVREANKSRDVPARLRYFALPKGKRNEKFKSLEILSLYSSQWAHGPSGWRDPLLPELESVWASFVTLSMFFKDSAPGVTAHRTWPIAPDSSSLEKRWNELSREKDVGKKNDLFQAERDRDVERRVKIDLGEYKVRPLTLLADDGAVVSPIRYGFRSFDRQWIIPDHRLISMARPRLWQSWSKLQIFVTAPEDRSIETGPAITVTELIPDIHHYHGRGGRVYPLWADAKATVPNISGKVLELLAETYAMDVSPEDLLAYIAAVMAHPAFTARFQKDLIRPGLRLPLTADAALFSEAAELGREVIWLHTYGERFMDDAAGRPKGPPRLAKAIEPTNPAAGAIPSAPEPLPDTMTYDAATRRLAVGKGFVENVSPGMWNYEISGKKVLWQWFSYRKRDRTKPLIGDKRPPSPLQAIQPEGWLSEYTTDLLNLLRVLGRLVALEPAQDDLLDRICAGKLMAPADLAQAGVAAIVAVEPDAVD